MDMDDERPARNVAAAVPAATTAVANRGVAIWRAIAKMNPPSHSHHHGDDNIEAVGNSSSTTSSLSLEEYSCHQVIPLSEGENWVIVSTKGNDGSDLTGTSISIVNRYDGIISDNSKEAWLCIDVDNGGQVVTVKDVRTTKSITNYNSNSDADAEQTSCFYLARKKMLHRGEGDTENVGGAGGAGSGMLRSTTCVKVDLSPKEMDHVDDDTDKGKIQLLYEISVSLPPRQIRLLHDGDRIWIGGSGGSVNLEYLKNIERVVVAVATASTTAEVVDDAVVGSRGEDVVESLPRSPGSTKGRKSTNVASTTPLTNNTEDDDMVHSEDELLSQPEYSVSSEQQEQRQIMWRERCSIDAEEGKMEAPPKHLSLYRNVKPSLSIATTALAFVDDDGDDSTECPDNDDEEEYPKQLSTKNVGDEDAVHRAEAKNEGEDEDDSTECPDKVDVHEEVQKLSTPITFGNTCINSNVPDDHFNDRVSNANEEDMMDQGAVKCDDDDDDVDDDYTKCLDDNEEKENPSTEKAAADCATEFITTHSDNETINANDSADLCNNTISLPDLRTKSTDITANDHADEDTVFQAETQNSLDECFQAETQALFFPLINATEESSSATGMNSSILNLPNGDTIDAIKSSTDVEKDCPASPANVGVSTIENEGMTVLASNATELKNASQHDDIHPPSPDMSAAENEEYPANELHQSSLPRDRKRKRPSSERRRETNATVKVMFTGINPTRKHKQMIRDIGAHLVDTIEEASSATHVIVSDGKTKLRRTPKLMICVCRTPNILSIDWLEQSAKEQCVLETDDFLLLNDKEAEKTYNFSMKATIENGKTARMASGGVLGGWSVYICRGVAGKNAPSSKEFALLIEAAGATMLRNLNDVPTPDKTIVITSDPITDDQRLEEGVEGATRRGAELLTTTWLFHTIITQQMCIDGERQPTPASGRQGRKQSQKAVKFSPERGDSRRSSRKRR